MFHTEWNWLVLLRVIEVIRITNLRLTSIGVQNGFKQGLENILYTPIRFFCSVLICKQYFLLHVIFSSTSFGYENCIVF